MAASLTSLLEQVLTEESKKYVRNQIDDISDKSVETAVELRTEIVNQWFHKYQRGAEAINLATVYRKYSRFVDDVSFQISVNSYVVSNLYRDKPKARAWLTRHPEKKEKLPPNEYVLDLQMRKGIIGLPTHVDRWGNKYQEKYGLTRSLRSGTIKSPLWSQYEARLKSKL